MRPTFSIELTRPFRLSSLMFCRACLGSGWRVVMSTIWNCSELSLKVMGDLDFRWECCRNCPPAVGSADAGKGQDVRLFWPDFQPESSGAGSNQNVAGALEIVIDLLLDGWVNHHLGPPAVGAG